MSHIFISYRRDDSAAVCGRIYDRLVDVFGRSAIFKDVDNIPLGVNFADHLARVLDTCTVQLVVIGQRWLDITDAQGNRRLDDPGDAVRQEVEAALRRGMPIIPLLVDGASVPHADRLPPSLSELPLQNGTPVRATDFDRDMDRVAAQLTRWVKPAPDSVKTPQRSIVRSGLVYGLVLALFYLPVAAVGAFWVGLTNENSGSSTPLSLTLAVAFLLIPGVVICLLAGRSAARTTGRTSVGIGVGLIAAIVGAVVGGAVFGALLHTAALISGATSQASAGSIWGGALSGAGTWLVVALVAGTVLSALGGLLGRRSFQRAARVHAGPR